MPVQDFCWKESVAGHRAHLTQAWRHNSVDCASRGLLSTELLENELQWSSPGRLHLSDAAWPKLFHLTPNIPSEEEDEICLHTVITQADPIVSVDRFSSFTRLRRVTAWLLATARFTRKA